MLPKDTNELLKKWGIDVEALVAAHSAPEEKPFTFTVTADTIKANFPEHTFLDEAGLNGLKGRLRNDVLSQAEEIGIKALKEKAGITFEGKDPAKFIEALTTHLKLPVDGKLQEKDRDIATLKETLEAEKLAHQTTAKQYKDRQDLDEFSKLLPANKTKILRDAEIRSRMAEDGYTVGEYEDNGNKIKALFKNGEVVKDKELKLVDPKSHISEWMKTSNLLEAEAPGKDRRQTFDVSGTGGGTSTFDHESAYEKALQAGGGKWNEKAQAVYTDLQVAATA